jgi:hypothetical protein
LFAYADKKNGIESNCNDLLYPLRGAYLRWMVFYGSFEPEIVDRAQKQEPAPLAMCPYGDYDTMH